MSTKTISNPKPSFLILFLLCGIFSYAQTPGWQWAKRVGSFNDNPPFSFGDQNERFNDIKVDTLGNIYAVGEFFYNSAFNNQTMGFPTTGGYGDRDAYLFKFNKCGKTLWWRRMGGTTNDQAKSLILDNNGHVILTGIFASSTCTIGDGSHDTIINGSNPIFLAKFDTAGNFSNANTYPNFSNINNFGLLKMFANSQGNLVITNGEMSYSIPPTLGAIVNTYTYAANAPYWLPEIRGAALDKNDNIYLCGCFNNTISIGPGTVVIPTGSANNALIMKFSPTGNLLWYNVSNSNTTGGDILQNCVVDTSGTTVITGGGAQSGTSVFGYTVNTPPAGVGYNGFGNVIFRFNATTGSLLSAVTGTTPGLVFISPMFTDKNNIIHCGGTILNYISFTSTATYSTSTFNFKQNCIGKFDAAGNFIDINILPQNGSAAANDRERVTALAVSKQGDVYIAGMFGGTLDSLGTAVNIIGGSEDGFIAKYGYPCGSAPTGSVPNVPLALAAVNNSLTNNITWTDNSNNETNFEVHYTISPSVTYSLLATLPANTTSYAHTGLSYTTTYCYKVAATNTIGMSAFSNTDCATTPAAPTATSTPNAPLNLSAVNNGSLTNTVAWTDNSNDEANFELHYTNGSSATYSLLATLAPNTTTYLHTGLSYTTTYCYKVAATNSVGMSAFSNTDCATTPAAPTETTGIAKNTADSKGVLCYPNPASTELYFDVPATAEIEIYNALGSLVISKRNYTNRSAIDISELSRGMYYYKIKTARNEFTGKVVKE